jgi:hypothetical protein
MGRKPKVRSSTEYNMNDNVSDNETNERLQENRLLIAKATYSNMNLNG